MRFDTPHSPRRKRCDTTTTPWFTVHNIAAVAFAFTVIGLLRVGLEEQRIVHEWRTRNLFDACHCVTLLHLAVTTNLFPGTMGLLGIVCAVIMKVLKAWSHTDLRRMGMVAWCLLINATCLLKLNHRVFQMVVEQQFQCSTEIDSIMFTTGRREFVLSLWIYVSCTLTDLLALGACLMALSSVTRRPAHRRHHSDS